MHERNNPFFSCRTFQLFIQLFTRDAKQADSLLGKQELFLSKDENPVSLLTETMVSFIVHVLPFPCPSYVLFIIYILSKPPCRSGTFYVVFLSFMPPFLFFVSILYA